MVKSFKYNFKNKEAMRIYFLLSVCCYCFCALFVCSVIFGIAYSIAESKELGIAGCKVLATILIALFLTIFLGIFIQLKKSKKVAICENKIIVYGDLLLMTKNLKLNFDDVFYCNYSKSKQVENKIIENTIISNIINLLFKNEVVEIGTFNGKKYLLPIENADEFIKEVNSIIKNGDVNGVSVLCPIKNDSKSSVTEIGIDYKVPALTDVFASSEGVVLLVQKWNKTSTGMQYLGNMIIVDNGNNVKTIYGNLHEVFIEEGMHINQGEKIATTGNTGSCNEPQLHFEVRLNGKPINPKEYLKKLI